MHTKKLMTLLLAAVLVLSLAACGAKGGDHIGGMDNEPKNAEEAAAMHKELTAQEAAILTGNTALLEKVFMAADKGKIMMEDGKNYGDFLLETINAAKDQFSADELKLLQGEAEKIRDIGNKLAALEADMRGLGTGIYWRAVENLHKQGGYLPTDYKLLAYIFRNCTPEELRHVVEDFDLFHYTDDGGKFYSERVLANLGKRDSISTARRNARNGVGAGTPGNGSEKAAGEQKNSEANKYTLLLLNTASRAFTQEEHQTFLKYNGPADDIVTFLETMFFTKCCTNAAAEVARFIQYYQPTGWKRKGEVVTDRISLLSGWKPDEGSGKISNKTGVTLLRNAYLGAKKAGDPQALYVILQTKGISFSNDNKVNILTGKEASQVITKHATINEGWNLDFRIK